MRDGPDCPHLGCRALAGHGPTTASADSRAALAAFCESGWPTVFATVRSQGYRGADAEDLTQAYFERFLERGDLAYAAAWRGCLLHFLRVSARHFLSNQRDRERARKRGGGLRPLSLDAPRDEPGSAPEPVAAETPETLLARDQAEATIAAALAQLRREMAHSGGAERLARVEQYLLSEVHTGSYRRMADEWGVAESAPRVLVHRLRKRLASLLRRAVRHPALRLRDTACA